MANVTRRAPLGERGRDAEGHGERQQLALEQPRQLEGDDEREQVDGQRHHPQERHGRDVLRDLRRRRLQQCGRYRGEQEPDDLIGACRRDVCNRRRRPPASATSTSASALARRARRPRRASRAST